MSLFRRRVTSAQLRDRISKLTAQLPELQRNAVEQSVAIVEDETTDRANYLAARAAVAQCRDDIRLLEGQISRVKEDEAREAEEAADKAAAEKRLADQKQISRLADAAVKQARQVGATLANYRRAVADLLDMAKSMEQIAPVGLPTGSPRNLSMTLAALLGSRRIDPDTRLGSLLATVDAERPRSVQKLVDAAFAKGDASMLIAAFERARDDVVPGLIQRRFEESREWINGDIPHTPVRTKEVAYTQHEGWEHMAPGPMEFPLPHVRNRQAYQPSDLSWPPPSPAALAPAVVEPPPAAKEPSSVPVTKAVGAEAHEDELPPEGFDNREFQELLRREVRENAA